jgi:hypothetical protein
MMAERQRHSSVVFSKLHSYAGLAIFVCDDGLMKGHHDRPTTSQS